MPAVIQPIQLLILCVERKRKEDICSRRPASLGVTETLPPSLERTPCLPFHIKSPLPYLFPGALCATFTFNRKMALQVTQATSDIRTMMSTGGIVLLRSLPSEFTDILHGEIRECSLCIRFQLKMHQRT